MNLASFKESIARNHPSPSSSVYLQALWHDAKGDWKESHGLIQDLEGQNAAWIHAYLHRKEGDLGNADYWYRIAGKQRPSVSLQKEWEELVEAFLK